MNTNIKACLSLTLLHYTSESYITLIIIWFGPIPCINLTFIGFSPVSYITLMWPLFYTES